jgi:hypothetical protein
MGFYGTLIGWCQGRGIGCGSRATSPCSMPLARRRPGSAPRTGFTISKMSNSPLGGHIGIIHDPGHAEPWIIAMSEKPGYLRTLEYSARWGIEPMFSDFKSRGFGIEDTQLRYADRLDRLILVMALYVAVSTGQAVHHPTPSEKKVPSISPGKSPEAEPPGSPEGFAASSS